MTDTAFHHRSGRFERCDECRFDSSAYTDQDVIGSLRRLGDWHREYCHGLTGELASRRPQPDMWSIAEYARHTKRVLWTMAGLAEAALRPGLVEVHGAPPADAAASDPVATGIDLGREFDRIDEEATRLIAALVASDESAEIVINGELADVGGIVRHALHDAMHHLADIGRIRHRLGVGAPEAVGTVAVINVSTGGVPKSPVETVAIGNRGLAGDRQKTRKHHGRVWQAVCLWSTEVIDALAAEGHPIGPGDAGENLTISGLDWPALVLGTRLRIGGSESERGVLLELTDWAAPCSKIAGSFADRAFDRISVDTERGWARAYAKVLVDGTVSTGDRVTVE